MKKPILNAGILLLLALLFFGYAFIRTTALHCERESEFGGVYCSMGEQEFVVEHIQEARVELFGGFRWTTYVVTIDVLKLDATIAETFPKRFMLRSSAQRFADEINAFAEQTPPASLDLVWHFYLIYVMGGLALFLAGAWVYLGKKGLK